jgi:hypothetical protein
VKKKSRRSNTKRCDENSGSGETTTRDNSEGQQRGMKRDVRERKKIKGNGTPDFPSNRNLKRSDRDPHWSVL